MLNTGEIIQGLSEAASKRNYALLTELHVGDPKIPLLQVTGEFTPNKFGKGLLAKINTDDLVQKKIWKRFKNEVQVLDSNETDEKTFKSVFCGVPYLYVWFDGKWFVRDENKKWEELSKVVSAE